MRIFLIIVTLSFTVTCKASALENIIIGICLPLTGHFSTRGQSAWEGIKVAHAMQPHVLGKPVQLKLINTGSDPAGATNTALAAIEKHGAVALVGDILSVNSISISHCTEKRGIPVITIPDSGIRQPIVSRAFMPCPTDMGQARVAAHLAFGHLKAKTAVVVYDISQKQSICLASHFAKEFRQAGGRIVEEMRCRIGDRDFAGQIRRMKLAKPDVVYLPIYHVECALLVRQAKESAINVPMIASDTVQVPEFLDLGGNAIENLMFTSYFREDFFKTESGKRFLSLYENRNEKKPQAYEALAAETYFLVVDAIRRANSCDPLSIREALTNGQNGGTRASAGERPEKSAYPFVSVVRGGTFADFSDARAWVGPDEIIQPPASATKSSRFPYEKSVSSD
jgi:branched-chain amino acid transport system substrate-binding protein